MRVLVTGASGQVGLELGRQNWGTDIELKLADRTAVDITDLSEVASVSDYRPHIIINAAAYSSVDRAEEEPDRAMAVNAHGVAHLARIAQDLDAKLIHLSTDYVFDGTKDGWYTEADTPDPLNVYGETKLAGERAALAVPTSIVLRTSWLFSALQPNFVITIRRLAAERAEFGVVADQFGCPTAASEVASAIARIVVSGAQHPGIFHLAAPDDASWWDLARETVLQMDPVPSPVLHRLTSDQYPTPAKRPVNSRLDSSKLAATYGIGLRPWREALAEVSAELNHQT